MWGLYLLWLICIDIVSPLLLEGVSTNGWRHFYDRTVIAGFLGTFISARRMNEIKQLQKVERCSEWKV
jgi:hypothetical protein